MLKVRYMITGVCLFGSLICMLFIYSNYRDICLLSSSLISDEATYKRLHFVDQQMGNFDLEKFERFNEAIALELNNLSQQLWKRSSSSVQSQSPHEIYLELVEFIENSRKRCEQKHIAIHPNESFGFSSILEKGSFISIELNEASSVNILIRLELIKNLIDCLIEASVESIENISFDEANFRFNSEIKAKIRASNKSVDRDFVYVEFSAKTKSIRSFIKRLKQIDSLCFIRLLNVSIDASGRLEGLEEQAELSAFFDAQEMSNEKSCATHLKQVVYPSNSRFCVLIEQVFPSYLGSLSQGGPE